MNRFGLSENWAICPAAQWPSNNPERDLTHGVRFAGSCLISNLMQQRIYPNQLVILYSLDSILSTTRKITLAVNSFQTFKSPGPNGIYHEADGNNHRYTHLFVFS